MTERERVARAWASMDGNDFEDPEYTDGYLSDAEELLKRAAMEEPAPQLWEDRKDDLTETIKADFKSGGDYYKRYSVAQELVSNRHSKGSLIALVCYLLRAAKKT